MNKLYIINGTKYKEMTKELLEEAKLIECIKDKSMKIGIKPNLVAPSDASYGATTHTEVVAGIIEYLKEKDYNNIEIIEGSWVGSRTQDAFSYCGYDKICEAYDVPFFDTQKDGSFEKDCKGVALNICSELKNIDFLINVPVLKGHCQTKLTCALKNAKGLIPNTEKRRFHAMGLHKPIAHLGIGIKQDFIVVDNICGDLDFEDGGHPVVMNRVWAANDPVLVDSYACKVLGYSVSDVPYVELAGELGVGSTDIESAKIIEINKEQREEVNYKAGSKVVAVEDSVHEVDSCSACYASLIPALDRLKEEGLLNYIDEKICIGQGYKGKNGKLGIGQCTSKFEHSLRGCPPVEEDVYEFLKGYIKEKPTT